MSGIKGPAAVHAYLIEQLQNYIKSQYFGKNKLLFDAVSEKMAKEGCLYRRPFIESSPAYKTEDDGISKTILDSWLKDFFNALADAGLGIFPTPFKHQVSALNAFAEGKDIFVSTGTGSGKTECFMWPLLAKLVTEAHEQKQSWEQRGVRTIIMYPMNALVSDQVGRLRRLIGDSDGKFIDIFRETVGDCRRPQFGMYTGRTSYPGASTNSDHDKKLAQNLSQIIKMKDSNPEYYDKLLSEGKIPAKKDLNVFIDSLRKSQHVPDDEDAELITRFEIQKYTPDILITNYSMLEYMLFRPQEAGIWNDTIKWLGESDDNKLLFIIDEAHMYRGASGGEVALLLRRLFHKLGISRDRVQFILTTASMPNGNEEDIKSVHEFACSLTSSSEDNFCYLTGEREALPEVDAEPIPFDRILNFDIDAFEDNDDSKLEQIRVFFAPVNFTDLDMAADWMYQHLAEFNEFRVLFEKCRGTAISLDELASTVFPHEESATALYGIGVLLTLAPFARNYKSNVLFPARMHMLFRGLPGVYSCTNENCPHAHSDGHLTLGEVFLSDDKLVCPHCGSVVYELYTDRNCGALFYKGYIPCSSEDPDREYLWHHPSLSANLVEIYLYIPPKDYVPPFAKSITKMRPCYLDVQTGFLEFKDDSKEGRPGYRKLYYSTKPAENGFIGFASCPKCGASIRNKPLASFSTRGNQSFFNLIKAQFNIQPPVPGKDNDPDMYPNQGRKVLLFSDSRQRAAKLARDMSEASDNSAIRQLTMLAIDEMEKCGEEPSFNYMYDYLVRLAGQKKLNLFSGEDRRKFTEEHREKVNKNYRLSEKRHRKYKPTFYFGDNVSPAQMNKEILKLYCGPYNNLSDCALSWIEPTDDALYIAMDEFEAQHIDIDEELFIELFNAWMLTVCEEAVALGNGIKDDERYEVIKSYGGFGLEPDWKFTNSFLKTMGWDKKESELIKLKVRDILSSTFLSSANNNRYYVNLDNIVPRFDIEHEWYICDSCSRISAYPLKGHCPYCGSDHVRVMNEKDYAALDFWRKPIEEALDGEPIRVIDTEEHTAQLSHKDQRDEFWSTTEKYELRFQDMFDEGESPVDILSSTTTMEVGIDIGSLVAVGLRNIPPMRENYQQRAGRAGRRGSSLSTIVTFCEGGPHDTLYFRDPVPMFRGDPRRPWIDIRSEKLIMRHLSMVAISEFLLSVERSLDEIPAIDFINDYLELFNDFLEHYHVDPTDIVVPHCNDVILTRYKEEFLSGILELKEKIERHPELYVSPGFVRRNKSMLDALYEEGLIPSYSFPKNVVSTYIMEPNKPVMKYQVDRGLDVGISEYAPGRSIVVDKTTYQIGGFYYPGTEIKHPYNPAKEFTDDPNYMKPVVSCCDCGWFGLEEEGNECCPFCGNKDLTVDRPMLKPWGFAPKNGDPIQEAQLVELYSYASQPVYSTLPASDDIELVENCSNIRMALRDNQRIIMMNRGKDGVGFTVCKDCGAAFPGDDFPKDEIIKRPYKTNRASDCKHINKEVVDIGYDFITDMLVLEFELDPKVINTSLDDFWLPRASTSLAEALRLVISKKLDIEFSELVTGYRVRRSGKKVYADVYIYDSLASGAGYAVSVGNMIPEILLEVSEFLLGCTCDSACYNCLKHYRNQNLHGLLDRHAALELLEWGMNGIRKSAIPVEEQIALLKPLEHIAAEYGVSIDYSGDSIKASQDGVTREIIIIPGMWARPDSSRRLYLSDFEIKYIKSSVVQSLRNISRF